MSGRNAFSSDNTTVAHDLVVAQKRKSKRNWERSNPARRYLIPVAVRDEVAALAEALMENVDPVACVLFDYAETCHARGTLKFKPRLSMYLTSTTRLSCGDKRMWTPPTAPIFRVI